ncbi:MAG TPA: histidine kinase [Roseiflexaceae bacterium]
MDERSLSHDQRTRESQLADLRFAALFEHSPFAIQICAADGRALRANRAYKELWGIADAQLARLNVLEHPLLERAGLTPFIRRALVGEYVAIPAKRYTPDEAPTIAGDRAHWIKTFILPVNDTSGAVQEIVILFDDVTEQEQTYLQLEQRVAERTRELSTLLEVSQAVTATLDLKALLGLVLDQIKTLIDYCGAAIFSIRDRQFTILDYRGPIDDDHLARLSFPIEQAGANQEVLRRRAPVIIDDVRGDTPLARAFQAAAGDQLLSTFGYVRAWMGVPLMVQGHVIGMLSLDSEQPGYYSSHHADLAQTIANQAAVAIENARLFEQAQTLAVLMERQRLARELHDSVSQALYGIALGARTAREQLARDPRLAVEPLDYVLGLANAGMAEMRALIFELRPESLASEGLVAALTKQADALRARHRLDVRADLGDEPELPLDIKETLYRIAQEALHNIAKHAHASRVDLRLDPPALDRHYVVLDIRDDGIGFDAAGSFPGHLGLRSMRERAARLGGALTVDSAPGRGAHIHVRIPVREA